tara:strand:- start:9611 stop:9784 length:174 start_codon:yes stop_codon:yes gene_type:complete
MKAKMVNMDGLSAKDKASMKKHSAHHSISHMKYMIAIMRRGQSFQKAHKLAMQKVGK